MGGPKTAAVVEVFNHQDGCNQCFYVLAASLKLVYRGIAPLMERPGFADFFQADVNHVLDTVELVLGLVKK